MRSTTAQTSTVRLPLQGFGLYKVPADDSAELTYQALLAGYRLIDTASFYGNEAGVGAGIQRAIDEGLLRRDELFVTSKLWNDQHGFDAAKTAYRQSLEKLGLDYLDLYLIHWPAPQQNLFVETFAGLRAIDGSDKPRHVGTSNFLVEHLNRLKAELNDLPDVNQVELHPWLQQRELRAFHREHGIATQAWSPLARGQLLTDPTVQAQAESLAVTPAQLILMWHRDNGISAIPKASSAHRIIENFELPQNPLPNAVVDALDALDQNKRVGSDPRTKE